MMKKQLVKLNSFGGIACLVVGFHLVSTQPNRNLPIGVPATEAGDLGVSGAGMFKEVLFFGDDRDDPKKPDDLTEEDRTLLAYYGG